MKTINVNSLEVRSPSFNDGAEIPPVYSCIGEDISPALNIRNIPPGTESLALILEDPDAPSGTFCHWLVWNIEPEAQIPENSKPGTEGKNSAGKIGYIGPCPPSGTHHYYFKIYAVDTKLNLPEGSEKERLLNVLEDHVLAYGELVGLFSRAKMAL